MSKLKRSVVGVLMLVSMALVLVSCGSSGDKDKFVGAWEANVNLTDFVNEQFQAGFEQVGEDASEYFNIDEFEFKMLFTFNDDDTYSISVDKDSLNNSLETIKGNFKDGFTAYVEDTITTMGLDMSVDEMLALSGMSMDDVINAGFGDEIIDGMLGEFEANGKWEAKDGKLYTTESVNDDIDENAYELYEITSDGIKLSEPEGVEDEIGIFPIVLTKAE